MKTRAGLSREGFEQRLEERLRDAVMHIPEGFACRGRHEGGYIEPVKAVMTKGDRPLADLRPDAPRYGLQAEPMLVACENFDGPIGVFFRFLDDGVRELFLNAASSSGVADFGFLGRGAWIDQPSAFSASQPRCGQVSPSPSSCAIQTAIFGLVHTPPSLGGSRKRSRSLSSSSGLRIVADVPLRRRRSPSESSPGGVVAGGELFDPARPERGHPRDLGDTVAFGQQPDRLEMPGARRASELDT